MAKAESKTATTSSGSPLTESSLAETAGPAGQKRTPAAGKRTGKTPAPELDPAGTQPPRTNSKGNAAGSKDDRGPPPPLPTPMATFKL